MHLFGIDFDPLNVSLEKRTQTFAAAFALFFFIYGGFICTWLFFYVLFFTKYYWLALLYLAWYCYDWGVHERGGRRLRWVKGWRIWTHYKNYFPATLTKVDGLEADPKKNYIIAGFPHGYVGSGLLAAFGCSASGFRKLFPHHARYMCTLNLNFAFPFYRELMMGVRFVSVSAKSINWLLSRPEGGHMALIVPGGAAEAYYCTSGSYKLVLKNRKGFIRLAIQNGTPVLPCVSFGETDLFTIVDVSQVPALANFAVKVKKLFGFVPLLANGRGLFQDSFGFIPRRRPINVVVGPEFSIEKNPNPTEAEVNETHAKFLQHVYQFFEDNKHKYLKDADDIHIEFV